MKVGTRSLGYPVHQSISAEQELLVAGRCSHQPPIHSQTRASALVPFAVVRTDLHTSPSPLRLQVIASHVARFVPRGNPLPERTGGGVKVMVMVVHVAHAVSDVLVLVS